MPFRCWQPSPSAWIHRSRCTKWNEQCPVDPSPNRRVHWGSPLGTARKNADRSTDVLSSALAKGCVVHRWSWTMEHWLQAGKRDWSAWPHKPAKPASSLTIKNSANPPFWNLHALCKMVLVTSSYHVFALLLGHWTCLYCVRASLFTNIYRPGTNLALQDSFWSLNSMFRIFSLIFSDFWASTLLYVIWIINDNYTF